MNPCLYSAVQCGTGDTFGQMPLRAVQCGREGSLAPCLYSAVKCGRRGTWYTLAHASTVRCSAEREKFGPSIIRLTELLTYSILVNAQMRICPLSLQTLFCILTGGGRVRYRLRSHRDGCTLRTDHDLDNLDNLDNLYPSLPLGGVVQYLYSRYPTQETCSSHADYMAPTRQHELDNTDQEFIWSARQI